MMNIDFEKHIRELNAIIAKLLRKNPWYLPKSDVGGGLRTYICYMCKAPYRPGHKRGCLWEAGRIALDLPTIVKPNW
jgi:hypothetical protein